MNLSDELHALTDHVPEFVRPEARTAWGAATRRRRQRRLRAGAALLLVALVVLAGVRSLSRQAVPGPEIDPAGRPAVRNALTLPTRIERPYVLHDLPRRAGRLAGVLWSKHQWLAVSPTGHLWRLPLATQRDYLPAISPDGSTIAFLQDFPTLKHSRLLVWNTTTAVLRFYSEIGTGALDHGHPVDPASRFWIQSQSPAYFSPDSKHLVVDGESMIRGADHRALLVDLTGTNVTVLDSPEGTSVAFPAGWLDDTRLVWIEATPQSQTAVITTVSGNVVRSMHLSMPKAQAAHGSQWVGPVSPDGRQVAFGSADQPDAEGSILAFPLDRDPSPYVIVPVGRPALGCPLSWGTTAAPAIPQTSPRLLAGAAGVVADPRLHADCAIWASDALAGSHHHGLAGSLFGLRTAWWTWWWRELTLGVTALVVSGVVLNHRRRRRS